MPCPHFRPILGSRLNLVFVEILSPSSCKIAFPAARQSFACTEFRVLFHALSASLDTQVQKLRTIACALSTHAELLLTRIIFRLHAFENESENEKGVAERSGARKRTRSDDNEISVTGQTQWSSEEALNFHLAIYYCETLVSC